MKWQQEDTQNLTLLSLLEAKLERRPVSRVYTSLKPEFKCKLLNCSRALPAAFIVRIVVEPLTSDLRGLYERREWLVGMLLLITKGEAPIL
jgi:hypothetical protein